MEYNLVRARMRQADVTISPDVRNINMLDFYRGRETVARGYEAASKRLARLANRLAPKR
jgi:predicted acylesterase/phospholipase RssA